MKKILCVLLVATMFGSLICNSKATEEKENLLTEAYVYVINPATEKWKTFTTLDEKIEAIQIPVEIVNNMSTTALVESVLNYPLLLNMTYFNSYESGYNSVRSYFYGLRHLETRVDAANILIKKFESLEKITEDSFTFENFEKYTAIECILSQPVFYNSLSEEEKEYFEQLIIEKYNLIEIYSQNSDDFDGKEPVAIPYFYKIRQEYSGIQSLNVSSTVTTPNGSKVSVTIITDADFTTAQKNQAMKWENSTYPNATRLRNPTNRYNCHSYAWYSQSSTNNVWMDYPQAYMSDGSYSNATNWSARVNARIFYPGATIYDSHSGIVTKASSTWSTSIVTSKWGEKSLMSHVATDCPYSYYGARFYYR